MEDKTQKLWFRRKSFGWGWTPCSAEGWLVMLVYLVGILKIVLWAKYIQASGPDALCTLVMPFVLLTSILICICHIKGEDPKWQWGNINNANNKNNMKTYTKKLYKSEDNKVFFGVLGGLGEYFDIDPVIFRVFYLAFSAFTGIAPGILAYLVMAMVMPKKSHISHE
ncbi:MAG: PspC domain-containing protein [bacterium]